jgi:hypothetical protein
MYPTMVLVFSMEKRTFQQMNNVASTLQLCLQMEDPSTIRLALGE